MPCINHDTVLTPLSLPHDVPSNSGKVDSIHLFTQYLVPFFRTIIKRVTALEYKLNRLVLNKADFIAYVQVSVITGQQVSATSDLCISY